MDYFLIAAGLLVAILSYVSGLHKGFARGYFAALFDLSVGEPQEYIESLVEDGDLDEAYLRRFGPRIDAGREGRN
jgi:hypothetical protein